MSWICSLIKSISSFFSSLFNRSSEAQLYKAKKRDSNKRDKKYWNNRLQQIFAECDLEELILMRDLVDSDNTPQETHLCVCHNEYRILKTNGVKEYVYQLINNNSTYNDYGDIDEVNICVRITDPLFKRFKKEFNKYGRCRLPDEEKKARPKK